MPRKLWAFSWWPILSPCSFPSCTRADRPKRFPDGAEASSKIYRKGGHLTMCFAARESTELSFRLYLWRCGFKFPSLPAAERPMGPWLSGWSTCNACQAIACNLVILKFQQSDSKREVYCWCFSSPPSLYGCFKFTCASCYYPAPAPIHHKKVLGGGRGRGRRAAAPSTESGRKATLLACFSEDGNSWHGCSQPNVTILVTLTSDWSSWKGALYSLL